MRIDAYGSLRCALKLHHVFGKLLRNNRFKVVRTATELALPVLSRRGRNESFLSHRSWDQSSTQRSPQKMNRTSLIVLLAGTMTATVGCASKNYVRQETTPLINKTNELDDLTAKNTKDIKDVDARAQSGIQQVQAKAAEVDEKAQAAGKQAD